VGYILIAGLWVVLSGTAADWLLGASLDSPGLHALKGMNFVLTTVLLMYLIWAGRSARRL